MAVINKTAISLLQECLLLFLILACCQGCNVDNNRVYQVVKVADTEGLKDIDWNQGQTITDFISPWRDAPANTDFKALWDENYLYFRFHVVEPNIMVYRDNDNEMEVVRSERVEIFFRKNEKLDPYYCLEMDASGRVFDYEAVYYRQFNTEWSWPQDGLEVIADNTANGYMVRGKISLESLEQLGLLKDQSIQVGLYRGQRTKIEESASDADFHWISWVDPKTKEPDFHVANSFGKFVLQP